MRPTVLEELFQLIYELGGQDPVSVETFESSEELTELVRLLEWLVELLDFDKHRI